MSQAEYEKFGRTLAFHAAPTLLGIKCANLVSLASDEFQLQLHSECFNRKAAAKGLRCRILCEQGARTLILVYHHARLEQRLRDPDVRRMLRRCGYPASAAVEEYLDILAKRIQANGSFPHDIGLFLDYPLEDVIGFIANKGENFKLCGYWKVYGSEEQARRTFSNYEKCRNFLCNKLNEGADLYQALRIS
ncbi:MAG: DUF3793 family protein [Ruminococcus sp.]|nr:DUF3793 family protein [Ruminococcus sp.]